MSQALEVVDVPTDRPAGVTKRQWRLAALLPRCETAYQAMIQAGYAPSTARKNSARQTALVGRKRAEVEIQRQQADSARGLMAVGNAALASNAADLKDLEPRDRLAAGFKAIELAHQLGESVQQEGSGDQWRMRLRRACRLMARLTESRLESSRHNVPL